MASLGKCSACNKTVYSLEGFKVGPPKAEKAYHKICFKCAHEGCTWKLDLRSYNWYEGAAYCKAHNPVVGGYSRSKAAVNVGSQSKGISHASDAPKLDTVKSNVLSREGSTTTADSMHIAHATSTPKLDTLGSGQVRGGDTSGTKCSECGASPATVSKFCPECGAKF